MRCARLLLDLRQLVEHLAALGRVGNVARDRRGRAPCSDPARCWAAPYPGRPRCTPCTACSSRECRAAFRGARRTSTPCRPWPRRSRPWPRAAWPAGRSRSASGTPRRMRRCERSACARPCPAGSGVERQPPVLQLASANGGQSRESAAAPAPRRLERSAAASSPILISFTRSKPCSHDFHVRLHDGFAELAELLHVLLVDDFAVLLLRDAELLQQAADRKECAEEGVALHAQLQIAAVGRLAGDFEAGQREDANLLVDDLLARPDAAGSPTRARLRRPTPRPGCRPPACRPADWCA